VFSARLVPVAWNSPNTLSGDLGPSSLRGFVTASGCEEAQSACGSRDSGFIAGIPEPPQFIISQRASTKAGGMTFHGPNKWRRELVVSFGVPPEKEAQLLMNTVGNGGARRTFDVVHQAGDLTPSDV